MYRVLVIFEKGDRNYSAYAPDLPGCIATGRTQEETRENMRGALVMHIESMIEDGEPIPTLVSSVEYMDISVPDSAT